MHESMWMAGLCIHTHTHTLIPIDNYLVCFVLEETCYSLPVCRGQIWSKKVCLGHRFKRRVTKCRAFAWRLVGTGRPGVYPAMVWHSTPKYNTATWAFLKIDMRHGA